MAVHIRWLLHTCTVTSKRLSTQWFEHVFFQNKNQDLEFECMQQSTVQTDSLDLKWVLLYYVILVCLFHFSHAWNWKFSVCYEKTIHVHAWAEGTFSQKLQFQNMAYKNMVYKNMVYKSNYILSHNSTDRSYTVKSMVKWSQQELICHTWE